MRIVLLIAIFVAACAPEVRVPPRDSARPSGTQAVPALPTRLLVARGDGSSADVYLLDRHGQAPKQLTSGPGIKVPVAASPDGTTFAYRVESAPDRPLAADELGLFIQEIDPSTRWSVRDKTQLFGHVASWSPDGRQIVFDAQGSSSAGRDALYVVDADGSNLRRLSPHAVDDEYPSWSPGGTTIAFHRRVGNGFRLRSINVDGSQDIEISHGDSDEWPVWSPDAAEIAYQSSQGIDILNLTSGEVRQLVPTNVGGAPVAWAPASLIAFACSRGEWVCVVAADGVAPRQVVEGGFPIWLPEVRR
jgi:Tol biopolymer transport system component